MTKLGVFISEKYPGMKLTYIAEKAGMTKQRLHVLMNNEASKVTLQEACNLANVLNVSVDTLCKEVCA